MGEIRLMAGDGRGTDTPRDHQAHVKHIHRFDSPP
jgi:hypothetical protein